MRPPHTPLPLCSPLHPFPARYSESSVINCTGMDLSGHTWTGTQGKGQCCPCQDYSQVPVGGVDNLAPGSQRGVPEAPLPAEGCRLLQEPAPHGSLGHVEGENSNPLQTAQPSICSSPGLLMKSLRCPSYYFTIHNHHYAFLVRWSRICDVDTKIPTAPQSLIPETFLLQRCDNTKRSKLRLETK